ncbi:MAG: hypothetical protein JWL77_3426 [Chthonomonadaceae bacterium]|nr:hypothetical protein [Chthonomonadaceae bacterium]
MTEPQTRNSDFEMLWQALERLLPSAHSDIYRAGLLGEAVRGTGQPPLASDLAHLFLPGLASLGIEAHLLPLPLEGAVPQKLPDTGEEIFLFGFAGPLVFAPPEEITDATTMPADTDPQITAQARLQQSTADGLPAEALRPRFSHLLSLQRSGQKALRRDSVMAALHRWLAWHAAYPERAPREAHRADPACKLAAAFLSEAVGTRRDFVSNRIRYAAQCFESARIEPAYRWLQEAAIDVWQLPAVPAGALLTPPEQTLSDVMRRELIYFARAGILPLKTLAARRLTHERHHLDAHKTLHQLGFDLHPWVRAAARPTFPAPWSP